MSKQKDMGHPQPAHPCDEYGQSTWRKPGDMLAMVSGGDVLAYRSAPYDSDSTMPVTRVSMVEVVQPFD